MAVYSNELKRLHSLNGNQGVKATSLTRYKLNCEINGFRAKLRELLINAWGEEGAATAPNPGNMLLGDIREAIIDLDSKHGKLMDEQPSDAAVDMQLFLQQHSILNQVLSCLKDS